MLMGSLPRYTLCALSMVITKRCSVISCTVLVFGTSTSMPDWRIGAVIMKMMRSTRTTSMNGIILISESDVCVCFESCGICFSLACLVAANLAERLFYLSGDFERECVQALRE